MSDVDRLELYSYDRQNQPHDEQQNQSKYDGTCTLLQRERR